MFACKIVRSSVSNLEETIVPSTSDIVVTDVDALRASVDPPVSTVIFYMSLTFEKYNINHFSICNLIVLFLLKNRRKRC